MTICWNYPDTVALRKYIDQRHTELAFIVAAKFFRRIDGVHLGVVLADKAGGRQAVKTRCANSIIEKLMDVTGEDSFNVVFFDKVKEPCSAGLGEVVVVALLCSFVNERWVV